MTEVPTYTAQIYIAGDIAQARRLCAQRFIEKGLCVTLEPVEYVYAGGCEAGMRVGLINYPRFPAEPVEIRAKALELAELLIEALCQWSASVVMPDETVWLSCRPEAA
jgi:hypothetical protein